MKKQQSRSEKNKKSSKIPFMILLLLIGGGVTWIGLNDWSLEKSYQRAYEGVTKSKGQDENQDNSSEYVEEDVDLTDSITKEEAIQYIEGQSLPDAPTYIDGVLIANKKYPLPSDFAPGESVEARGAFNEMAAAALLEGYSLVAFSTYRSFDRQVELYNGYVARDGVDEADRYSARPGYSEHQTGMAFDIGEANREQYWASTSFGETEAAHWLAKHAHVYGFVMRYPEGKERITGYMHEAWHFRYVGVEIAEEIYWGNGTIEEYLGI